MMPTRFTHWGVIALAFAVGAWADPPRPRATLDRRPPPEPRQLETLDDAYLPKPRPRSGPAHPWLSTLPSPYPLVQVNIATNGTNIPGDAANEPSIAIDPVNPLRMAIGWRQFDTVSSNFRQAGWGFSEDGGRTWTFPGVIEPGVFRSDPVLAADPDGTLHYYSLSNPGDFGCELFSSVDGGQSWSNAVPGFGGDKAWMAIDTTEGPGRGHIYAKWQVFFGCCDGTFTRSIDGGQSFETPIPVPREPGFGTIAAGPDGEVYVAGIEMIGGQDFDTIVIARSDDASDGGAVPTFAHDTVVDLGGSLGINAAPNPGGLAGQVVVAVDHSTGPTRGDVYVMASVNPPGQDPLDVMVSRSSDGGVTWSDAVRVNDVATGWQWFGTLAVAPNGRLDAVWNDTRNSGAANLSELFYAYSLDGGATWSPNRALSPIYDSHAGWPSQNKMGDYYDMISDAAAANLACAATFNGEQDVYFVRIGDCNDNGVHDGQDLASGSSADCNANGTPDDCEFVAPFARESPALAPISGATPQSVTLTGVPPALGSVTVQVAARADLGSPSERLEITLNGTFLGVLFEDDGNDCLATPDQGQVVLSATQFNTLVPDGTATVAITSTPAVGACDSGFAMVSLVYAAAGNDCNANDTLDTCDIAQGASADCNANAVPDECELEQHVVSSRPPVSPIGDTAPQAVVFATTPPAQSDVTIGVAARADLGAASERLDIALNGTLVATVFADDGTDCPVAPDTVDVVVEAALYNDLVAGGDAVFGVVASGSVNAGQCTPPSSVALTLSYTTGGNDCNANGVLDVCDVATGAASDCNANGIPDACEMSDRVAATSPPLGPLGSGAAPAHTFPPAPPATGPVTVTVQARADLGGLSETVTVALNGVALGELFASNISVDCPAIPETAALVIAPADFNALVGGGSATFALLPSSAVNAAQCDPPSTATVALRYATAGTDCNANGQLDTCDIADGSSIDCNGNGRPDDCELGGLFVAESGPLTPIGQNAPQDFALSDPPVAIAPPSVHVDARADLGGASERLDLAIDGVFLDTLFVGPTTDCPDPPETATVVVPVDTFNAAAADGAVVLTLTATAAVNADQCDPAGFVAFTVSYATAGQDCNDNAALDACDIAGGTSPDCNANGLPDECELDGNDCNANGTPDACDIAGGTSPDCNANGLPDECELDGNDCNTNGTPDACDIAGGTSLDLDGNGVPDECDPIAIIGSDPPDGAVDARQPTALDGSDPTGWSVIELTFDGDTAGLTAADFALFSAGGDAPAIAVVTTAGANATVTLDTPIPVGACTAIVHVASASRVRLGYLPADVTGDGTAGPLDILALVDQLNGVADPPLALWQCDANRSAVCEPLDILRVIDLINGAGAFEPWNGMTLPACP